MEKSEKPHKFNWRLHLGNFLMISAVLLALFVYYPFLKLFFPAPYPALSVQQEGFQISIPKINANAPVIPNVDPFNEIEYKKSLENGVAHAKGTVMPDS